MPWILKTPRGTLTYPTKIKAVIAKIRLGEGGTIHEERKLTELTGTKTGRTSARRPVLSHPKQSRAPCSACGSLKATGEAWRKCGQCGPTIRTTEGDVPLRNLRQTDCPHESWDRRSCFSEAKNRHVYWCHGCCGNIEYVRHPVSGVLLELVIG